MFVTNKALKKMIKSALLKEVSYTEPFSGTVAYFIVNFLAADRLRKLINPDMHSKTPFNPMIGFEINKFDFKKTYSENIRTNKPSTLPLTNDEIQNASNTQFVEMFENHSRSLKNAFEWIAKRYESMSSDQGGIVSQFGKGSVKKMFDQWTGVLRIRISPVYNGISELIGANFNSETGEIEFLFDIDANFMNKNLQSAYSEYETLLSSIKHIAVHELVHARQSETDFKRPETATQEDRIPNFFDHNYFAYKNIDPLDFPQISALQDIIKTIVVKHLEKIPLVSRIAAFEDLKRKINNSSIGSRIQNLFDCSKVLAQLFSPEEVEAYVRGYRAEVKKNLYNRGITKNTSGPVAFYQEVENGVREIVKNRFKNIVSRYMSTAGFHHHPEIPPVSFNLYEADMIEGYMKVYKRIFG